MPSVVLQRSTPNTKQVKDDPRTTPPALTVDGWVTLNAHVANLTHSYSIHHLNISNVIISESEWHWLCRVIPSLQRLEILELDNLDLGDVKVSDLIAASIGGTRRSTTTGVVPTYPSLRVLSLQRNALTYRSMSGLGKFCMAHCLVLRSLRLGGNALGDHGAQVLAVHIGKLNLATLRSHEYSLFPEEARTAFGMVQYKSALPPARGGSSLDVSSSDAVMCLGLEHLDLSHNRISLRGVSEMIAAVTKAQSLTHLSLAHNIANASLVGSRAVFSTFPELCRRAALVRLDLSWAAVGSQMTPDGVHAMLLSVLFNCDCLTTLHLTGSHPLALVEQSRGTESPTRVADVFAELLFQIAEDAVTRRRQFPHSLSTLQDISLAASGLSDDGAKALAYAVLNSMRSSSSTPHRHGSSAFILEALKRFDVSLNYLSADGVLDIVEVVNAIAEARNDHGTRSTNNNNNSNSTVIDIDGKKCRLACELNALVTTMSDVDAIYETVVDGLYKVKGAVKEALVELTFGPFDVRVARERMRALRQNERMADNTAAVLTYSCRQYCEEVRGLAWEYRSDDEWWARRGRRGDAPSQQAVDSTAIVDHTTTAGAINVSAIPRVQSSDFDSPATHHRLDDSRMVAAPRDELYDAQSKQSPIRVIPSVVMTPSAASQFDSPQHAAATTRHNDKAPSPTPQHYGMQDGFARETRERRPLVSPPREEGQLGADDIAKTPSPVRVLRRGADLVNATVAEMGSPAAGAPTTITTAPTLRYGTDPLAPAKEGRDDQWEETTVKTTHDQAPSIHRSQRLESLQSSEYFNEFTNGKRAPSSGAHTTALQAMAEEMEPSMATEPRLTAPRSQAPSVSAATTAIADDETKSNLSSSVVTGDTMTITAADRAAARKAKLETSRRRRKKLLGDDDETLSIPSVDEPQPRDETLKSKSWRFDTLAVDASLTTKEETSTFTAVAPDVGHQQQTTDETCVEGHHRESQIAMGTNVHVAQVGDKEGLLHELPAISKRCVKDPNALVGRVKSFTLTYTHPAGHVICRAWRMLSRCSSAMHALEQDVLDLLQPPLDDGSKTVDHVAGALQLDGLSIDFTVTTNEKRATIAHRLQDAAARGAELDDVSHADQHTQTASGLRFSGKLTADQIASFPRLARLLLGYQYNEVDGTTTVISRDIIDAVDGVCDVCKVVSQRLALLGDKATLHDLHGCATVSDWVHANHEQQEELLQQLPAAPPSHAMAASPPQEAYSHSQQDERLRSSEDAEHRSEVNAEYSATVAFGESDSATMQPRIDLYDEASPSQTSDVGPITSAEPVQWVDEESNAMSPVVGPSATTVTSTDERIPLIPSDLPWALPVPSDGVGLPTITTTFKIPYGGQLGVASIFASEGDANETNQMVYRLNPNVFSKLGGLQDDVDPQVGDSPPRKLFGASGEQQIGDAARDETLSIEELTADDENDAVPPPPPEDDPQSPHRLTATVDGNSISFNDHAVGDRGCLEAVLESFGAMTDRRISSNPSLSFLRSPQRSGTSAGSPNAAASRTPRERTLASLGDGRYDMDGGGVPVRSLTPFRRSEARKILQCAPELMPVDPAAMNIDVLERRMRSMEKLCVEAVSLGVVQLSPLTRNKVRVCRGSTPLPYHMSAMPPSASLSPSSTTRAPRVKVTLSIEWEGLLVLKKDNGVGSDKDILMVHPLAYGITATMGGEGSEKGLGLELVITASSLTMPSDMDGAGDADPTLQLHKTNSIANRALIGRVSDEPPSSPLRALDAVHHVATYSIRLESSRKVSQALRIIEKHSDEAKRMLLKV